MIVKAKGGSKKIHLSEDEITLDQLKECSHTLYTPNIPIEERQLEIHNEKIHRPINWETSKSFKEFSTQLHNRIMAQQNKLYVVISEEIKFTLQRIAATDLLLAEKKWRELN